MLRGSLYKPNAAAVERISFLSDHLDTSENYCASIINKVVLQQPNLPPIHHVELATREYYAMRDALLGIWVLLLSMLVAARQEEAQPGSLIWQLAETTTEIIKDGEPNALLSKILAQIDTAAKRVEDLEKKLVDATSQTSTATSLRDVVLEGERDKVLEQRRQLASILVQLCETRELSVAEILHLLEWISNAKPKDEVEVHTTTAALVVLSSERLYSPVIIEHFTNKRLVTLLLARFSKDAQWKSAGVRAALQIQCSLFLVACRAADPVMCDEQNASVDAIEALSTDAMESDGLNFLNHLVVSARGSDSLLASSSSTVNGSSPSDSSANFDPVMRSKVYSAVESTVLGLLVSLPTVLKRLKHRQEDIGVVARKPPQPNPFVTTLGRLIDPATSEASPRRTDIATLFRLIGTLYDALPAGNAQKFWAVETNKSRHADTINSRLPSFLRWAAETRGDMVPAVYDMLTGLAKGKICSEHAYNFLSTGGVATNALVGMHGSLSGSVFLWAALFGSLGYYAENLPNPRTIQQYRQQGPLPEIRVEEATLLVSFLRLLRVVAKWSVPARLALADHPQYRAVPSMLQLATCRIPLELKGALYEAVAAFCSPDGGTLGVAICRNTWLMLEQVQVLDTQSVSVGVGSTHGIKYELTEVEIGSKVYPCTSAFLRLIDSLIHTPKDFSPKQVLFGAQGGQTIPDGLGAPLRSLPLAPYISFVVDDVLFLGEEMFNNVGDRWLLKDLCLQFVEKALASYDLESLPAALQALSTQGPQSIRPWVLHPGFDVMSRLLSDTPLRAIISDFLAEGPVKLEKNTIKTSFFTKCMRRVIRIVYRILDIQSFFLDMLVPAIQAFDFSSVISNFSPGQLNAFDRHLLFNHILVERIALLVALDYPEMQLFAIRVLGLLALSPHFTVMDQQASRMARRLNRLALIVQNSDDSLRINDGFASLLSADSVESSEVEGIELRIGAGAPESDEGSEEISLTHLIRMEIIEMLLKNTEKGRPSPNIAHLLLGFDVATASKNEMAIQDPSALNSSRSCFHVITEMLNDGIPSLDPTRRRQEDRLLKKPPLYYKAPALAEKCHHLLHQLCAHELTSKPAARYLRTREDYFARNLSALPIRAQSIASQNEGMATYADGISVDTNCHALTSFLRMRSWILESVALELHILTEEGQFPRASRLLDILFTSIDSNLESLEDDVDDQFFGGGAVQVFAPGQSLMRVLEIFQSFDLTWQDSASYKEDVQLVFFASLDYSSCLRIAESGAEIIDRDALVNLLSNIRRSNPDLGSLAADAQAQLASEMRYLLESCVKENNRREIEYAKSMGFEAWRQVVNVALTKCFDRLPVESREGILFDLLQEVPPVLRKPTLGVSSTILLSEVTVMLITKLREDRSHRILVQSLTDDSNSAATSLPEDRFHSILKSLLESVLSPGMPEVVRGNLYASIINNLQLVQTVANAKKQTTSLEDDVEEDSLFGTSKEVQRYSSLEMGSINIINSLAERLIPVVCRDAVDGSEVWKTVAFTLLDSLVRLSRIQRQHKVLHLLAKGGYLSSFSVGLKEADEELQSVVVPDPRKPEHL
jgi:nuclear pore complex protein Nup205